MQGALSQGRPARNLRNQVVALLDHLHLDDGSPRTFGDLGTQLRGSA